MRTGPIFNKDARALLNCKCNTVNPKYNRVASRHCQIERLETCQMKLKRQFCCCVHLFLFHQ